MGSYKVNFCWVHNYKGGLFKNNLNIGSYKVGKSKIDGKKWTATKWAQAKVGRSARMMYSRECYRMSGIPGDVWQELEPSGGNCERRTEAPVGISGCWVAGNQQCFSMCLWWILTPTWLCENFVERSISWSSFVWPLCWFSLSFRFGTSLMNSTKEFLKSTSTTSNSLSNDLIGFASELPVGIWSSVREQLQSTSVPLTY